jgi:Xaa-Pro aminopeptidase
VTTDKVCSVWPKAQEFGFRDELSAFGLQFGHGLGLNLHERPIISRVVSMDHPTVITEGMVFALETYCPASDGYSAARIEEEVVVTDKGHIIISLFPAEELPIANRY